MGFSGRGGENVYHNLLLAQKKTTSFPFSIPIFFSPGISLSSDTTQPLLIPTMCRSLGLKPTPSLSLQNSELYSQNGTGLNTKCHTLCGRKKTGKMLWQVA